MFSFNKKEIWVFVVVEENGLDGYTFTLDVVGYKFVSRVIILGIGFRV
jgi:hypothetical protein